MAAVLALNAPASLWAIEIPESPAKKTAEPRRKTRIEEAPTTYFAYVEKDPKVKDRVVTEVRGWTPGNHPFAFFFLPVLDGQPPLLVSEWAVAQALN